VAAVAARVVGFAGASGSGKTTLIEGLIAALRRRGLRVSVIKHAHHGFELDVPGKDSWRHREAGACEVLVASPHLLALQRPTPQAVEYRLDELLPLLQEVDWVLVEGYRSAPIPRIEVWRAAVGPRAAPDPLLLAVASDTPERVPAPGTAALLDLNQPAAVADWLLRHQHLCVPRHASSR
jgi:molybdopterin-guanine dinucleotide biosynthesis protein B